MDHSGAEIGYLPLGYIIEYMNKNSHKRKTFFFYNKLNNLSGEEFNNLIETLNKKIPNYAFSKQHNNHPIIVATCIE